MKDVAQLSNPLPKGPYGTVISNPPYGERLDSEPALIALHSLLGRTMKNQFGGWNLSLFSASPDLLGSLQLRADKQFKAKNGPLDCVQKTIILRKPRRTVSRRRWRKITLIACVKILKSWRNGRAGRD